MADFTITASGGSAVGNPLAGVLTDFARTEYTDEDLLALIASVDNKIVKMMGLGVFGDAYAGVDYKENGDAGHELRASFTLEALVKLRAQLQSMLADPSSRGDIGEFLSQWDDPNL